MSLKYALIDRVLEVATQHGIAIYGAYVRDVLAYRHANVQLAEPTENKQEINLWATTRAHWDNFARALQPLCDVSTYNTKDSSNYIVDVIGHQICKGEFRISPSFLSVNFDVDLLICQQYDALAGSCLSVVGPMYTVAELVKQITHKQFRVIKHDGSITKFYNEMLANGWRTVIDSPVNSSVESVIQDNAKIDNLSELALRSSIDEFLKSFEKFVVSVKLDAPELKKLELLKVLSTIVNK